MKKNIIVLTAIQIKSLSSWPGPWPIDHIQTVERKNNRGSYCNPSREIDTLYKRSTRGRQRQFSQSSRTMSSSFASSRTREIEHRSASACKFETGSVVIPASFSHEADGTIVDWKIKSKHETSDDDDDDDDDDVNEEHVAKCMMLASGTTVRVAPMERSRGGWDDEHFHEHLRLPEGSNIGKGLVVMFEGESLANSALVVTVFLSLLLSESIYFCTI